MLSFFPTPYPDEVLYSVLARYHIRSANLSPKATLKDLFSTTNVISTVDLPAHLQSLSDKLSHFKVYTFENLINELTLYRFYSPFLMPGKAEAAYYLMRFGTRGIIHTKIGIMASSVKTPIFLRFCPECFKSDYEKYGESYWRRLHQVPGVLVCPKHFCLLSNSNISISQLNRHSFYPANDESCTPKIQIVRFTEKDINDLVEISREVEWLLCNKVNNKKIVDWRKRYTSMLIYRNLASFNGRINQRDLEQHFKERYSFQLLKSLDSLVDSKLSTNWLSSITRKHRKSFHPIRHILLIKMFGYSLKDFFEGKFQQNEIVRNTIVIKPNKKKAFDDVWKNNLKELISTKKYSLREIARRMNVTTRTINRHAQKLGLETYWQKKKYENFNQKRIIDTYEIKKKYRRQWAFLIKNHKNKGKTELRRIAPSVYMWLYRNDKDWMQKNSPRKLKPIYKNKRVDWEQRDLELLSKAHAVCALLFSKNPPVKITKSRIGKELRQKPLVEKHLKKLPKLKKYIEKMSESIEEYQKRRIIWAISKLNQENSDLKVWRIIRYAGLKKKFAVKFQDFIDWQIQIHSPQNLLLKVK
jgi:hypothetical protein